MGFQIAQFESQMSNILNLFGHIRMLRLHAWCPKFPVSGRVKPDLRRDWQLWAPLPLPWQGAFRHRWGPRLMSCRGILLWQLTVVLLKVRMIHMPTVPNHQWNNDWIQWWQPFSVCQTEWFTMSKTVRILIKRPQTAMIVLGSPQVFVFQLALLNHLQRTVTGQRMRGYEAGDEEELVVEEKTERHLVDGPALQSANIYHCPTMQLILEFGRVLRFRC